MFVKMMMGATGENRHVGVPCSMVEAERIEFSYDAHGRPFMKVWNSGAIREMPVYGDVFLMSDTGQTLSRFSPPLDFVGRNADGWKTLHAQARAALVT